MPSCLPLTSQTIIAFIRRLTKHKNKKLKYEYTYLCMHIQRHSALPLNQLSGHLLTSCLIRALDIFIVFFFIIIIFFVCTFYSYYLMILTSLVFSLLFFSAGVDQRFPLWACQWAFMLSCVLTFLISYFKQRAKEPRFVCFFCVFIFFTIFYNFIFNFQLQFLTVIVGHFVGLTGHSLALQKVCLFFLSFVVCFSSNNCQLLKTGCVVG